MDWDSILATVREKKLSKEQGLKLIEDVMNRVRAARSLELETLRRAYEKRGQFQEREIEMPEAVKIMHNSHRILEEGPRTGELLRQNSCHCKAIEDHAAESYSTGDQGVQHPNDECVFGSAVYVPEGRAHEGERSAEMTNQGDTDERGSSASLHTVCAESRAIEHVMQEGRLFDCGQTFEKTMTFDCRNFCEHKQVACKQDVSDPDDHRCTSFTNGEKVVCIKQAMAADRGIEQVERTEKEKRKKRDRKNTLKKCCEEKKKIKLPPKRKNRRKHRWTTLYGVVQCKATMKVRFKFGAIIRRTSEYDDYEERHKGPEQERRLLKCRSRACPHDKKKVLETHFFKFDFKDKASSYTKRSRRHVSRKYRRKMKRLLRARWRTNKHAFRKLSPSIKREAKLEHHRRLSKPGRNRAGAGKRIKKGSRHHRKSRHRRKRKALRQH